MQKRQTGRGLKKSRIRDGMDHCGRLFFYVRVTDYYIISVDWGQA
jgi:hypothetical protein